MTHNYLCGVHNEKKFEMIDKPMMTKQIMKIIKMYHKETLQSIGPVSYTHLDVYKRQLLDRFMSRK